MPIEVILQVLIGGILLGGLYALIAFGLSLIYGIVKILNFAHGTMLAVCGIAASVLYTGLGLHPLVIAIIITPLVFLFGYLFYRSLIYPLESRSEFESVVGSVLVTVGAMLILSDVATSLASATQRNIQLPFHAINLNGIVISTTQMYVLLGIVALTILVQLFLSKAWLGRAIRAVTQDRVGAQICGVHSIKLKSITFAFGSATVAIAAILYTISYPVSPYMGFPLTVKAFTIIILGGIGNLRGALYAGVFLGVAESMTSLFWDAEWAPAVSVVLMLVILIVFPKASGQRQS